MQTPLTQKQQCWLDHVNQASTEKISMLAYAKKNGLPLKTFYHARSTLEQKGFLPPRTQNSTPFMPVTITSPPSEKIAHACRVKLTNGVVIECSDIDLTSLLNSANQL